MRAVLDSVRVLATPRALPPGGPQARRGQGKPGPAASTPAPQDHRPRRCHRRLLCSLASAHTRRSWHHACLTNPHNRGLPLPRPGKRPSPTDHTSVNGAGELERGRRSTRCGSTPSKGVGEPPRAGVLGHQPWEGKRLLLRAAASESTAPRECGSYPPRWKGRPSRPNGTTGSFSMGSQPAAATRRFALAFGERAGPKAGGDTGGDDPTTGGAARAGPGCGPRQRRRGRDGGRCRTDVRGPQPGACRWSGQGGAGSPLPSQARIARGDGVDGRPIGGVVQGR